jgi:hypothetical protein
MVFMDECYWEQPLVGNNGRTENGTRKYRDVYFEHNGNISCEQIADMFNTDKRNIENHKYNYQWDRVLADKKAYLQRKRDEKREENYQKHLDKDFKNADTVLTIKYTQIQMAAVKVGIMQPIPGLIIPDELTFEKAWDTINRTDLKTLQTVIMRDLEKSGTINDKQKIESENINTNLNIPLKTTDEVLDENADTITRFIERRMHTTDSTTD